jgi:E3 ubiquitin-protein ligase RFWD2
VGLSCFGDYIACGSENNSVYAYYKDLSKPAFSFKFDEDDNSEEATPPYFVSSVCWKKSQNILLAANSQGTIKVLELV